MSLTFKKLQRLQNAKLNKVFNDHRPLWRAKAQQAYDYTKNDVEVDGNKIRCDDMLQTLESSVELLPELVDYLTAKHLTPKYWTTWFAEYIIDSLWDELKRGG